MEQMTLTADIEHLDLERIIIAGAGEATIDWGDGKSDTITLPDTEYIREKDKVPKSETQQHRYEEAGTYTITITGDVALLWIRKKNNTFHALDVSRNPALKFLECKSLELTSLNVNGCTALTELDCHDNKLTTLDVSKNTALTKLECSFNQLTSLDVSQNTALTDLYCFDNQLTETALNALFGTLPNNTKENCFDNQSTVAATLNALFNSIKGKCIYIDGNPGADDCDHDIATDKGWKVWGYD